MAVVTTAKRALRELARRVRDIAAEPVQDELRTLWRARNSLQKGRPLILLTPPDQVWRELLPKPEETGDPIVDRLSNDFRRRIYHWEHWKDDQVITADVQVPLVVEVSDWIEGRQRPYSGDPDRSAHFAPCLIEPSDLAKLRLPEVRVDRERSNDSFERVSELIGDILPVSLGTAFAAGSYHSTLGWGTSAIDILCEMRGLDQLYTDFLVEPNFVHDAMDILTRGILRGHEQLEAEGVLRLNNVDGPIGPCGLGYVDDLPKPGFDPTHIMLSDLWGFGQAQELAGVGVDTLEEFVLPYQAVMLEKFGLNAYGCCEDNGLRWEAVLRRLPRLRILSVSPWSDHEVAATALGDRYVYCWKPHPARMISTFSEDGIRNEMRRAFEITRDCCVVVCLRDTQTVDGEPWRLDRWVELAKEASEAV